MTVVLNCMGLKSVRDMYVTSMVNLSNVFAMHVEVRMPWIRCKKMDSTLRYSSTKLS